MTRHRTSGANSRGGGIINNVVVEGSTSTGLNCASGRGVIDNVVIEGPDGRLHGSGPVIASADAWAVRPQDCGPVLRGLLFRDRA